MYMPPKTVEEQQVTNKSPGFRRSAESGGGDPDEGAAAAGSYKSTQPTAAAVNGDHAKRASPESDFGMGKVVLCRGIRLMVTQ